MFSDSEQSRRIQNIKAEIAGNLQRINLADISSDERAALIRKNQELQRRIEGLKQEMMRIATQKLAEMKAKDDARKKQRARKLQEYKRKDDARKRREAAKNDEHNKN